MKRSGYKLCPECGQPMLKKGQKRLAQIVDLIDSHHEPEIISATASNAFITNLSTEITISNASEKTITVTFPKPYEAKEAK